MYSDMADIMPHSPRNPVAHPRPGHMSPTHGDMCPHFNENLATLYPPSDHPTRGHTSPCPGTYVPVLTPGSCRSAPSPPVPPDQPTHHPRCPPLFALLRRLPRRLPKKPLVDGSKGFPDYGPFAVRRLRHTARWPFLHRPHHPPGGGAAPRPCGDICSPPPGTWGPGHVSPSHNYRARNSPPATESRWSLPRASTPSSCPQEPRSEGCATGCATAGG